MDRFDAIKLKNQLEGKKLPTILKVRQHTKNIFATHSTDINGDTQRPGDFKINTRTVVLWTKEK